jgi:hypothetical protein
VIITTENGLVVVLRAVVFSDARKGFHKLTTRMLWITSQGCRTAIEIPPRGLKHRDVANNTNTNTNTRSNKSYLLNIDSFVIAAIHHFDHPTTAEQRINSINAIA